MFVFCPFLVKLCWILFPELIIVEGSGLNNFVGIVALQLTFISDLSFCALKRVKSRVYSLFLTIFSQTLRDTIFRSKHCRGIRFEQFCRYCYPPAAFISDLTVLAKI